MPYNTVQCNTAHINQSSFSVKPPPPKKKKNHQDFCSGIRTHAGGVQFEAIDHCKWWGAKSVRRDTSLRMHPVSPQYILLKQNKAKLTPANKLAFAIVDLDAFAFGQIRRFLFTFMPLRFGACRYAMYMKQTLFCQPAWIMYFGRLAMLCSSLMHMPTPHSHITPP